MNVDNKLACRICNLIGNHCFAFEWRGWEYDKDPFPPEALELLAVDEIE